jgi:hypothetical protein
MQGSIKITKFTSANDLSSPFNQHNWPLIINATSTGDMPDDIFVFARKAGVLDVNPYDQFQAVASAHDIFEIGTDPGATNNDNPDGVPFYRSSMLKLFLRSPAQVEEIWQKIQEDVVDLVRNLEAENRVVAVESVEAEPSDSTPGSVDVAVTKFDDQPNQAQFSLDYRPAGLAAVDGSNNQTIDSADSGLSGWLPVSEIDPAIPVPANAKFFYNLAQDSNLSDELPFLDPGNQHMLFLNGQKLTYGATYTITSEGIFWLDFDPVVDADNTVLIDGDLLLQENLAGNAPWPLDYVDRNNPGATVPDLDLLLFRA